jgi:TonB family protein
MLRRLLWTRMIREPNVPLFLWIATAILAHIVCAGGADRASNWIEQQLLVRDFARSVQQQVALFAQPVEVALLDSEQLREIEDETNEDDSKEEPANEPEQVQQELAKLEPPEPEKTKQPDPPVAKAPAPKEEPEKPSLDEAIPKKKEVPKQILELRPDRRIAVRQHVKDPNQEDNPDAEFIGNEANRVKEQTQASITSTDQDDPNPNPGGRHVGPDENPGDSDENRLGQSDDKPGDPELSPADAPEPPREAAAHEPPRLARRAQPPASRRRAPEPQHQHRPPQEAQSSVEGESAKLTSPEGSFTVGRERVARRARKAPRAMRKRLPPRRRKLDDLLGLGASGLTENGVSLNLTPNTAVAAIGQDRLRQEQKRDGERRRSKHRGSWKKLGIERWRAAIENYVPHVRPGNQTALNTARVPFANYLNHIHNRIHPVFADTFLSSLDSLPKTHPMNRWDMSSHVEIVLNPADGRIVQMGITKTSGVTAFDIGALESVQRASPFGPAPSEVVSPNGNVYLHWEFHRNPYYACSTYFARPYIIKGKPKPAPPKITPPRRNPFRPQERPPAAGNRTGRVQPSSPQHTLGKASFTAAHRRHPG